MCRPPGLTLPGGRSLDCGGIVWHPHVMAVFLPGFDADTLGLIVIALSLAVFYSLEVLVARRQIRRMQEQLNEARYALTTHSVLLASLVVREGGRIVFPIAQLPEDTSLTIQVNRDERLATIELGSG